MRSQPLSSGARASVTAYGRSSAPPLRAVVSVPSWLAAMPRNSTGMAVVLVSCGVVVSRDARRGRGVQARCSDDWTADRDREQVAGDRVVLAEAGAVEAGPGESAGAGGAGDGWSEEEAPRVNRSVGTDAAGARVRDELPRPQAGAVGGSHRARSKLAGTEQVGHQRVGDERAVRARQPRVDGSPGPYHPLPRTGHEPAVLHGQFEVGPEEADDPGAVQREQLREPARRGAAGEEGEQAVEVTLHVAHPVRVEQPARDDELGEDGIHAEQRVENGPVARAQRVGSTRQVT